MRMIRQHSQASEKLSALEKGPKGIYSPNLKRHLVVGKRISDWRLSCALFFAILSPPAQTVLCTAGAAVAAAVPIISQAVRTGNGSCWRCSPQQHLKRLLH